ncbi:MAG: anti-sigma factor family protein [Terracidiphilus sp.]
MTKKNCMGMESELAAMLLEPDAVSAKVREHVAKCERCQSEMRELKATMELMDAWQAPEPSPYFMTRLGARIREEREAEPAGWLAGALARLRARLTYGSSLHVRPLAAMALTIMLLVGGGTYLGITDWMQPAQSGSQDAAVVHDLQTLDSNAQVLDQMESLSSSESGD